LNLEFNKLTDISNIKNLKNIKNLYLSDNEIKDISVIQNFKELEILNIQNLELESLIRFSYINKCKKLKYLWCSKGFENSSAAVDLINKNINIYSTIYE